ncbi:hypothetical protein HHI36_022688 [Cryptolaemus montrouzieri]|uniref:C2H2-type domain-containing protein n=1 Tax=Cryptolaemus montrouzieri TaxID=559131 RepID=A0ABD2N0G9_9CUCU
MNLSQIKIEQPFEYNEVENKTVVQDFIDSKGKMWQRNLLYETHGERNFVQVKNEYETNLLGDSRGVEETKSFMNEHLAEDRKIGNQEILTKYEIDEEFKIEDNCEEIITKIKVELSEDEIITNAPEVIDSKREICHDGKSFEDSVKEEEREKKVSTIENSAKSIQQEVKKRKCSQCDYQTSHKTNMDQHIKSVHLRIKGHNCTYCDFQTSQKSYLTVHMNSKHLGIKNTNAINVIIKHIIKILF